MAAAAAATPAAVHDDAAATQTQRADAQRLWADARASVARGLAFLAAAVAVFGLYVCAMPKLRAHEVQALVNNFPPKSVGEVITLRDTLLAYAQAYPASSAVGILMLYVIMQTFAIPGTISLSLLSGALYGSTRGFALVAAVSTLGACSCYGMSCLFGRPIARAIWKQRLEAFSSEVARRQHDLLSYIVFLRVTPLLPNVFINIASPIVGVPLWEFALGTLIGCAPNNFMAANAGDHLSDLDSLADLYNPRMLLLGLTVGAVALLPVVVKHRHGQQMALLASKVR